MKSKSRYLILILVILLILPLGLSGARDSQRVEFEDVSFENVLDEEPENAPEDYGPLPNKEQLEYYDQELSAFMHYGPNTFTGLEWGNATYTIDSFQGREFHAEEMVKILDEVGFKRLIITAKHHDGFCLWNSAFTEFDLENSGYDGDILEELSTAASEIDMDMGLYLSPWDIHEESYGYGKDGSPEDDKNGDYNEFYINQIREINKNDIYGNDGHFVEWWMDGAKGQGEDAQEYDFPEILETIREDNEGILVFGAIPYRGGVHWIGNENGYANADISDPTVPGDYRIHSGNMLGSKHIQRDINGDIYWSVPEADVSLSSGWFWAPNRATPKSMEELASIYFGSVGEGVPLLLNIAPNRDGTYDQSFVDRLYELKENIDNTFSNDFTQGENVSVKASNVRDNSGNFDPELVLDNNDQTYWTTEDGVNEANIEINLGQAREFDIVSIEEFIEKGLRIYEFKIDYKNGENDSWKEFYSGRGIGAKRLARRTPVIGDRIRISVKAKAVPLIDTIGVYKASEGFEIASNVPAGLNIIEDNEFDLTGTWNKDNGSGFTNGSGVWSDNTNNKITATFTGTKAYVLGTVDPNHGLMEVFIDGVSQGQFDTNGPTRKLQQIIFESEELEYKEHTIEIKPVTKAIGVDCICYLDNNNRGMFEIEEEKYIVNEIDNSVTPLRVKIKRVGGSLGEASVDVTAPPGSAVQGQYYQDISETLVFQDGETEKTIDIYTIDNETKDGHKDFFIQIANSKGGILGFNKKSEVTLLDDETLNEGLDEVIKIGQEKVRLEAEDFVLEPRVLGEEPNNINKNIRIREDESFSNGKAVTWFETGNRMKKYLEFDEPGVYNLTMKYQSGRPVNGSNNNTLNTKGSENIKVEVFSVTPGGENLPWLEETYEITVLEKGLALLRFEADEHSSPNIDYFDIEKKDTPDPDLGDTIKIYSDPVKIEAEDFNLEPRVPDEEPNKENKNIRITENESFSNGKAVTWFETGNRMNIKLYFEEAGKYNLKAKYQSGRPLDGSNNNTLNTKGSTNIKEEIFSVTPGGEAVPWMEESYEITVLENGLALLRFEADEHSSPNIDYFVIEKK